MTHYKNVPADWSELVGKTIVYMDPTEGDEQVNFMATTLGINDNRTYYTIWFHPHGHVKLPDYTDLTKRVLVED